MKFCNQCTGARLCKMIVDGKLQFQCLSCLSTTQPDPKDTLMAQSDKRSRSRYDVVLDNAAQDQAAYWVNVSCTCGEPRTSLVVVDDTMKTYLKCPKCKLVHPYSTLVKLSMEMSK